MVQLNCHFVVPFAFCLAAMATPVHRQNIASNDASVTSPSAQVTPAPADLFPRILVLQVDKSVTSQSFSDGDATSDVTPASNPTSTISAHEARAVNGNVKSGNPGSENDYKMLPSMAKRQSDRLYFAPRPLTGDPFNLSDYLSTPSFDPDDGRYPGPTPTSANNAGMLARDNLMARAVKGTDESTKPSMAGGYRLLQLIIIINGQERR